MESDREVSFNGNGESERGRTMLSFAPDSPRKLIGVSLTPSYMTPFGNMDCEVIPKMKVRNVV